VVFALNSLIFFRSSGTPDLVCNSQQVQHAVCRAAQRAISTASALDTDFGVIIMRGGVNVSSRAAPNLHARMLWPDEGAPRFHGGTCRCGQRAMPMASTGQFIDWLVYNPVQEPQPDSSHAQSAKALRRR
jgi:hypothetical protein